MNASAVNLFVGLIAGLALSPSVWAQGAVTPVPAAPKAAAPAASDYLLDSSTLKTGPVSGQQATAAPYSLSSTSFSGGSSSVNAILTAAVPENAASYKMENGIYLYPSVDLGYGHNDNMRLTRTNTLSSDFLRVTPRVLAELKHKGDRYTATAVLDRTTFFDSSSDNRTDYEVDVAGDHFFTARARAGWTAAYVAETDDRGTLARPVSDDPDRWHAGRLNARLIYGAPEAKGRIEVDLGYQNKTYDNNRLYTATDDHDVKSLAGRFYYRLGSRSLALVEARNADFAYDAPLARVKDSNERRYYLGLTWDATAATTGIFKIGRMRKDFDLSAREDFSGSSWEAAVRWLPRTYSVFELVTSRSTQESTGVGTYDLDATLSLNWKHDWSQSLRTEAMITRLDRKYGESDREDAADILTFTADYAVLRWLKMGVDLSRTDYTSTDDTVEYKRNVVMFTLKATL